MMTHTTKHKLSMVLAVILFFIGSIELAAQQTEKKVGDQMPDYKFQNLINYPSSSARLSDFGDKMIILDFWSTGCSSCIDSWPKLIRLQDLFSDQLQIILVNARQNEDVVKAMFAKRKKLAGVDVDLPTVCGDSTIDKMFPRQGVPHVIWIDKQHTIRSITFGTSVTEANIAAMLKDATTKLVQKEIIPMIEWTSRRPMFVNGNGGNGEGIRYTSLISDYVQGLTSSIGMVGDLRTQRYCKVTATNASLSMLYAYAYSDRTSDSGRPVELPASRVNIAAKDSVQFKLTHNGALMRENLYCYELLTDTASSAELQKKMKEDLRRYFGYRVECKKAKIKCMVLSMDDSSKVQATSGAEFAQGITASMFGVNGAYTMKEVIQNLEELYLHTGMPVLDETRYKGRLHNINLEINARDHQWMDRELQKYGLRFKEEYRRINILVVSDPGS